MLGSCCNIEAYLVAAALVYSPQLSQLAEPQGSQPAQTSLLLPLPVGEIYSSVSGLFLSSPSELQGSVNRGEFLYPPGHCPPV